MHSLVILSSLLLATSTFATKQTYSREFLESFDKWKVHHSLTFSPEESRYRLSVFAKNVDYINTHNNAGNHGHTLAINKWAHLTHDEWMQQVGLKGKKGKKTTSTKNLRVQSSSTMNADEQMNEILKAIGGVIPASVNWTTAGGVTPVKDQGQVSILKQAVNGTVLGM